MFSTAPSETSFSYHKAIWIILTDYNMYFHLIVLSTLTATVLLMNRSISKFYSFITFTLQINAVILLLNYTVLMSLHVLFLLSVISPSPFPKLHCFKILLVFFTPSVFYGVQQYVCRLRVTGISCSF